MGDVTVTTWNAQALFASNPQRHAVKASYVHHLMVKTDVLLVTESHGTEAGNDAWRPPSGCSAWWSQGPTAGHSGVGFVIEDEFLRNFDQPPRLHHIWRGRAAKLCLRGASGTLDLIVDYFPSGSQANPPDTDLAGIPARFRAGLNNFPAMRAYMRQLLANNVKARSQCLTVLGGDFNYVTDDADRVSLDTALASGRRGGREVANFQSTVAVRHGLFEMYQGDFTHSSATARSRLDRIYFNHDVDGQLDRRIVATSLEWCQNLSHHSAVRVARLSPVREDDPGRPLARRALLRPDFTRRLILDVRESLRECPEASPFQQLALCTASMRRVARGLENDFRAIPAAVDVEDKLGVALKLIRAIEGARPTEVSTCLARFPGIRRRVDNPYDFDGNLTRKLFRLRQFAVHLARGHAVEELRHSQPDLTGEDAFKARGQRAQRRILKGDGEVTADPADMAGILGAHWSETFAEQGINDELLDQWLEDDADNRPLADLASARVAQVRLRKSR
ncbi:unnamed protein product, partial [Prorocentrum cordatum]